MFAPARNTSGLYVGDCRLDWKKKKRVKKQIDNLPLMIFALAFDERCRIEAYQGFLSLRDRDTMSDLALFSTFYILSGRFEMRHLAFTLPYVLSHHLSSCVRRAGPKRLQEPATTARLNSIKDRAVAGTLAQPPGSADIGISLQLYSYIDSI